MKILLISHTCQSRTEGQPKAHCLARLPDVQLRVLVPDRWLNYGAWRPAEPPLNPSFTFTAGRVRFPWVGPAQFYLHYYPRLAALLREFKPDIIDLWEEPWGLVSVHACSLRRRLLPTARIVSETEQNTNKHLPFPFEEFRRKTLRQADFAVGRNQEAIDILRRKGYTGPARVVPNAVDSDLFRPLDRAAARRALGFSGFVVGYVGRLVAEKGLMDLVDALPACPANTCLVLVGSGDQHQPLLDRAAALDCADRVQILPGRPLDQLPQLMNALDVLVLPSRTTARWKEQFGRVIIEAGACQTPVIGSDSGAIPEVVGTAGLIFPEGQPLALAASIQHLHGDPKLCRDLGLQGRAQVEARYTWQRVAEQMHAIYRQVLGSSTPPAIVVPEAASV